MEAVGMAGAGGSLAEADRHPGQAQGEDIGEVVPGVGEQRQRVGGIAGDGFDDDKCQGDGEGERQARAGLPGDLTEMRMGVIVRVGMGQAACSMCSSPWRKRAATCSSSRQ